MRVFAHDLENNIFTLHNQLKNNLYHHSDYSEFYVHDPKLRHIHKAPVSDRVLHHAIVRIIEPLWEPTFIYDSYSNRANKGTHAAVKRFNKLAWKLSRNNTKTVWVLKCDIKKFFDSIDHEILLRLVENKISDEKLLNLIAVIVRSFENSRSCGLPLGNLTSQLFSNVYLDPLDQFIKRELRVKYYIRYADDFVLLDTNLNNLEIVLPKIRNFLKKELNMKLHENKVIFRRWSQGIDFLGYISFPHHTILRIHTRKRLFRKIKAKLGEMKRNEISSFALSQGVNSYLGLLKHCRGYKIESKIKKMIADN